MSAIPVYTELTLKPGTFLADATAQAQQALAAIAEMPPAMLKVGIDPTTLGQVTSQVSAAVSAGTGEAMVTLWGSGGKDLGEVTAARLYPPKFNDLYRNESGENWHTTAYRQSSEDIASNAAFTGATAGERREYARQQMMAEEPARWNEISDLPRRQEVLAAQQEQYDTLAAQAAADGGGGGGGGGMGAYGNRMMLRMATLYPIMHIAENTVEAVGDLDKLFDMEKGGYHGTTDMPRMMEQQTREDTQRAKTENAVDYFGLGHFLNFNATSADEDVEADKQRQDDMKSGEERLRIATESQGRIKDMKARMLEDELRDAGDKFDAEAVARDRSVDKQIESIQRLAKDGQLSEVQANREIQAVRSTAAAEGGMATAAEGYRQNEIGASLGAQGMLVQAGQLQLEHNDYAADLMRAQAARAPNIQKDKDEVAKTQAALDKANADYGDAKDAQEEKWRLDNLKMQGFTHSDNRDNPGAKMHGLQESIEYEEKALDGLTVKGKQDGDTQNYIIKPTDKNQSNEDALLAKYQARDKLADDLERDKAALAELQREENAAKSEVEKDKTAGLPFNSPDMHSADERAQGLQTQLGQQQQQLTLDQAALGGTNNKIEQERQEAIIETTVDTEASAYRAAGDPRMSQFTLLKDKIRRDLQDPDPDIRGANRLKAQAELTEFEKQGGVGGEAYMGTPQGYMDRIQTHILQANAGDRTAANKAAESLRTLIAGGGTPPDLTQPGAGAPPGGNAGNDPLSKAAKALQDAADKFLKALPSGAIIGVLQAGAGA